MLTGKLSAKDFVQSDSINLESKSRRQKREEVEKNYLKQNIIDTVSLD